VVSSVLTARIYGVDVIGKYALAVAPTAAVFFLSTIRERPALIRELTQLEPRAPRVTGLFAAVFTFSFGLTAVASGIGIIVIHAVYSGSLDQPELFLPAVAGILTYLLLANTSFNLDTVFASFRAGRQLFWIRLHEQLMFMLVAVGWGLHTPTIWGLVAATTAAAGTTLVHRCVAIRGFMRMTVGRGEFRAGFRTLPGIIRFGLKVAPGSIADGISNEVGTWGLGYLASVASVGAYNRAWLFGRRFLDISFRVNEMLFPTLVERRATGDHAGFDRALVDSIRYAAIGMLLPAASGGGAAPAIMDLFGPGFAAASDALAVILVMPVLATASNLLRHTLYAIDEPIRSSVSAIGRMLITVAGTVGLVLAIGITGAALAVLLGLAADLLYMYIVARPRFTGPVHRLWPFRQVGALVVAYLLGMMVARVVALALDPLGGAVLGIAGGGCCYVLVFVGLGGINQRDKRRIQDIWTQWRRRRAGQSDQARST